jgi:HD-GYP domain-containing protein (c-di-GMP phosphodiesterase class II)
MSKYFALDKTLLRSLVMMAVVVEARDAYTGGHLWRVAQLAWLLALEMGYSHEAAFAVMLGGLLHDLGKVGVSDAILNKRNVLTPAEFDVIKTHPGLGAALAAAHPLGPLVGDTIRYHHERIDGTGYPERLEGEEIPRAAQIVALADALDAMTSQRPYSGVMSLARAREEASRHRGRQFQNQLVAVLDGLAFSGKLDAIVGHSDIDTPVVTCPNCGPVIAVSRQARDGDIVVCRVCGSQHRLYRRGNGFAADPIGKQGSAEQLKPQTSMEAIDDLIAGAPRRLSIPV